MTEVHPQRILEMTTEIVVAFLAQRALEPEQLAGLVREVRAVLREDLDDDNDGLSDQAQTGEAGAAPIPFGAAREPAVPVSESVTDEYIISLEDGQRYRSLRRHLMAKHGMTPDEYRAKWNLPSDYPMVAPSYARDRSDVAKRIGLGRPAAPKPARDAPRRRPR